MNNYEKLNKIKEGLIETPMLRKIDFADRVRKFERALEEFEKQETNDFIKELLHLEKLDNFEPFKIEETSLYKDYILKKKPLKPKKLEEF